MSLANNGAAFDIMRLSAQDIFREKMWGNLTILKSFRSMLLTVWMMSKKN